MRISCKTFSLACLVFVGCAQTRPKTSLLSPAEMQPGSAYEVGVYVLAPGDSVASVCRKFGIHIADFEALNPDLHPTHPLVGEKVKIYVRPMK